MFLTSGILCLWLSFAPAFGQDVPSIKLAPIQKAQAIRSFSVMDSVRVFFPVSKSGFNESFEENGKRLRDVGTRMKEVQSNERMRIDRILIFASSSPEGSAELNERLARERARSIAEFLHSEYRFDDAIVDVQYRAVDWNRFRDFVEQDNSIPNRSTVLQIIGKKDVSALAKLRGTNVGNYLLKKVYPSLRSTFVVFEYTVFPPPEPEIEIAEPEVFSEFEIVPELEMIQEPEKKEEPEPEVKTEEEPRFEIVPKTEQTLEPEPIEEPEAEIKEKRKRAKREKVTINESALKVNALTLPLLVPNIGYEYLVYDHWSASLQIYYTALDWFSIQKKFRVLGFQGEIRRWFDNGMMGPFVAVHTTFGYYNIAWGGKYRYQDHKRSTPVYGVGLNGGYKIPLGRDKQHSRYGLEFSIGAGLLPLHYDIYYNVENGRLAGEDQKTYFGIDNAAITFTYWFDRTTKKKKVKE